MAILTHGPFGRLSGKIGNMVFYPLKGRIVSRTIGKYEEKPTSKQLANRQRMRATMDLLIPMQSFIKQGFEQAVKGTLWNAFNLATSLNKKNALQGEYPNINVDYSKVVLSAGTLPLAKDLKISKTDGGLLLEWNPEEHNLGDRYDDLVMVALYHSSSQSASMYLNAGKRSQGTCLIPIQQQSKLDAPMEAYVCFKNADGEFISDSIYLGNINGAAKSEQEQQQQEQYILVKDRFDKIEALYKAQADLSPKDKIKSKALKHLRTEYHALKEKLVNMPGKSV